MLKFIKEYKFQIIRMFLLVVMIGTSWNLGTMNGNSIAQRQIIREDVAEDLKFSVEVNEELAEKVLSENIRLTSEYEVLKAEKAELELAIIRLNKNLKNVITTATEDNYNPLPLEIPSL